MHILIVASWYKKRAEDVHASFIEEQARMLMRAGLKVGVFHPCFIGGFKDRLKGNKTEIKHFNDNGLQTWYYGEMSIVPHFRSVIYKHLCRKADELFQQYVKENGMPDMLHAHSVFMGGMVANYLSKKYKIPYCYTEHASKLITEFELQKKIDKKEVEKIVNESKKTTFVSTFQLNKMRSLYNISLAKISAIPNILNPLFTFQSNVLKEGFTICIIGNLTENKNHILLFDAIKTLKTNNINCLVKVIGEGETRKSLERYVDENALAQNVIFLGSLSRENVFNELIDSHCLVSVSKFETFGINLIEAMGVGRPVISTNSGGPSEIVTKENGILLNSYNTNELVEAIIFMKDNYHNYNLKNISDDCHAKYSEQAVFNLLIEMYN